MFDLNDKLVLITGASRGLGKATAKALGQAGATIIGTATSEAGAEGITADLNANNIEGRGIVLDVTKFDTIPEVIKQITAEFRAPEILVNNAGITRDNLFMRMKEDEWDSG